MPRIVIVGERAWRPEIREAWRGLLGRQKNLAAVALRYMHDLHIGLTPELAASLARALRAEDGRLGVRADRSRPEPWARVFERLAGLLVPERKEKRTAGKSARRRYAGLVPGASPFYSVAKIAAPLVARALEELDRTYLFAAEAEPCPRDFPQAYRRYSAELSSRLSVLASSDELSEVFWTDRALTLSRLSRTAISSSETPERASGIPELDALTLGPLLRLAPEVSGKTPFRRSVPRRLTSSPRDRPLQNRNEGGVDGIFQTRRLADMPSLLMSEFVHPPPLLFDRLLQSGYLALRRPPLREKKRDVWVAGLLPPLPYAPPGSMAAALVKASWFDTAARLAAWLRRVGLKRSLFQWIEPDEAGRRRESRCRLEILPETALTSEVPTPADRREFLAALGWLPDFVDRHASGRAGSGQGDLPTAGPGSPSGALASPAADWAAASWRAERTGLEDYDTVHLMLFLPRNLQGITSLGALRHKLGLPFEPGKSWSVTWLPETLTDCSAESGWAFSAERKPTRPLLRDEVTRDDRQVENRLAGALVGAWLRTLVGELLLED